MRACSGKLSVEALQVGRRKTLPWCLSAVLPQAARRRLVARRVAVFTAAHYRNVANSLGALQLQKSPLSISMLYNSPFVFYLAGSCPSMTVAPVL